MVLSRSSVAVSQRNTRMRKRSGRRRPASRHAASYSSSAADYHQNRQTSQQSTQSTDAPDTEDVIRILCEIINTEEIPGFYYDSARKKYFRILPGQNSSIANAVTAESVKEKEAEAKRQLHLTRLSDSNSRHTSHAHNTPSRKPTWQYSHNITDKIFSSRLGQCTQTGQQRIVESFVEGLRPCGSRRILEPRSGEPVGYGLPYHMLCMKANRDQDTLLCLWSLKDDRARRIQLLHVDSFIRSHRKRRHKIDINIRQGDTVIVQECYQITGLDWTPQLLTDNDHCDYIIYTTSPFMGNADSLAVFRCLDCRDPRIFHCEDFKLGKNTTWCCGWNRHAKQFAVGCEGKVIMGDVDTRQMWDVCVDKSSVLSLGFSRQGSSVLYSGTRRGHVSTHDSRTPQHRCESQLTHPSGITCLHLMTDENYLLASDMTGDIRLWDIRQQATVQHYKGNYNENKLLPFHVDPTETVLYAAGQDCYTRLWSVRTSRLLCTLPPPHPASKSLIPTLCYFSPMGKVTTEGCPGLLLGMLDELHYYSL